MKFVFSLKIAGFGNHGFPFKSVRIDFLLSDSSSAFNFQSFDGYIDHIWRTSIFHFLSNGKNVTTFRSPNLARTISSDPLFFSAMSTEYECAIRNALNSNCRAKSRNMTL